MQSKRRLNRLTTRRSALAGGIAAVAAVGAGAVPVMCRGQIYPGMQFGETSLAGHTPEEAEQLLRSALTNFENRALTFSFEEQKWQASLEDIGFSIDYEAMVDIALAHGRTNGALDRYQTFVAHDRPVELPLILTESPNKLESFIESIADDINIPAMDARLTMSDGELVVEPEVAGRKVDSDLAFQDSLAPLHNGEHATIALSTVLVEADVKQKHLAGAREDAWNLISKPVVFTHNGLDYPVNQEHLTKALQIDDQNQASIDPTALLDRFQAISQATRVSPRNVMLGWDSGLYVVADDVDGVEVDIDQLQDLLVELAHRDDRSAELPMEPIKAAARADNINELGIETHLAYGSSSFAGSSTARAENVRVSARNISYKLVAPGEMFSYNDLQGPITEEHGYVSGTIISGNWVESDIGGGVCQVSTTVFRAAAKAGFRFSEWNPHSWRLAFYEADGSDPGLDAAIYQAESEWEWTLDLTFENTLDSWLLIMVVTDGDWVTAHLYGKDPGWNVEMFPAQVSNPIQPGPAAERENSSLAPGERRMVQQAQPGYLVRVRRLITSDAGEVLADGEFVSDYVPQPEAWEIGPGG